MFYKYKTHLINTFCYGRLQRPEAAFSGQKVLNVPQARFRAFCPSGLASVLFARPRDKTIYEISSKNLFRLLWCWIFGCFFLAASAVFAGQSYYVYSAQDACGAWQKGKIGEKETIFTDRADVNEYMELDVPESGDYQVYLSLYHDWRKYCPFLYCKLIDSKGKAYLNYVFSEPRWYLEEGQGRWEYRCLSAAPYWYLHKGKVRIKFWVRAKKSCWEREDVLMPSSLAVGEFVLIPVDMKEKVHVNLTLP